MPNQQKPSKYRLWGIVPLVLVLDQVTKGLALQFFSIVKNTGTIFGLFAQHSLLVLVGTMIVLGGVLYATLRVQQAHTRRAVYCANMLIIGGGLSNALDRVWHGFVTDFIHLPLIPTFNFADCCISCGVVWLLWIFVVTHTKNHNDSLQKEP